jgi:hypothetical protein
MSNANLQKGADALARKLELPQNLIPLAVRAHGLTDPKGNTKYYVNEDGELVDPDGEAVFGGDDIGTPSTIPAGDTTTLGANSQAVIYGTFTILGTLVVEGEIRFGDWPF